PSEARAEQDQPQSHQATARSAPTSIQAPRRRYPCLLRCVCRDGRDTGGGVEIGGRRMVDTVRKSRMKEVPLSEAKDDLSHLLREAEKQDIVITRHGKPAGILIGFKSEEEWFEYRLQHDERFLRRIESARK